MRAVLRLGALARLAATLGLASVLTAAGSGTRIHVYAFFKDGKLLVPALAARDLGVGYCLHGSPADGRPDAWYCISQTKHQGIEPCFSDPHASSVACDPIGPPGRVTGVSKIRLSRSLPLARANTQSAPATGRPWIIRLESGALCWVPTGTGKLENGTVRGKQITYGCDPPPGGAAKLTELVGDPYHRHGTWRILSVTRGFGQHPFDDQRSRLRSIDIAAAWW
jgi:hypothetical protein